MEANWKNDARLQGINGEKLRILTEFAEKAGKSPRSEIMKTFITLNMEAQKKGIRFSDSETELLVSILTKNMPESQKKKLDTLKMMSKKLSRQAK